MRIFSFSCPLSFGARILGTINNDSVFIHSTFISYGCFTTWEMKSACLLPKRSIL